MILPARRHARFLVAAALGMAAAVPVAARAGATDAILVGADLFFAIYLAATAIWVRDRSGDDLRAHFADADEGGALIVLIALLAVGCSLYAIIQTVVAAHRAGAAGGPAAALALRPMLALAAVPLGWATIHTVMALHYARLFYRTGSADGAMNRADDAAQAKRGGLAFPEGAPDPGPWEFLYYSFTLGMTAQTSDVAITDTVMRRVTLAHSVLSYFYNAVIVALAVNAGMALGQGG